MAVARSHAYAYGHEKQDDGGTVSVPEIDPTAITGPLVLLATGTLILTDQLRRKRPSDNDRLNRRIQELCQWNR